MPDLTKAERFVLEWLAKEDVSSYGECRGVALEGLIERGLARVGAPVSIHARDQDYLPVSLTDAGWAELKKGAA